MDPRRNPVLGALLLAVALGARPSEAPAQVVTVVPGRERLTAGARDFEKEAAEPWVVPRLRGPVVLDGMSDEPAWTEIPPLPAVVHSPDFGAEPSERTELRVAHDDQYLYAAGRMWDSDAAAIQASSLRRDDTSMTNDWFVVTLDPFNDNENSVLFGTTPAGIRTDVALEDDGEGMRTDWDALWEAAVRQTDEGWFAEIRIPLSSLRFQERDGRVIMGLTVWRHIARKNERISFPAIPPRWGTRSVNKASQTRAVVLEGVRPRSAVAVTPYLLGGSGRTHFPGADGVGYEAHRQEVQEAGLAVKAGVARNLVLDVTWNTDFAQVEADDQELNLTRFPLSLPEKRPFFLERASAFQLDLGDGGQLFHSRRIGIEGGLRAPILGGARLVGRSGEWDVALLQMATGPTDHAPGASFGVARVRRRVWNARSHVGAAATSRAGEGRRDVALGADAHLHLFGQDHVELAAALSRPGVGGDSVVTEVAGGAWDRSVARARWERRGLDGLGYAFEGWRIGPRFDPPVGSVRRTGYVATSERVTYGWRGAPGARVFRRSLSVSGSGHRRLEDGVWESADAAVQWASELRSGRRLEVGARTVREALEAGFELGEGVEVPAGVHAFHEVRLAHQPPRGSLFRLGAEVGAGSFYDGKRTSAALTPAWSPSRHLELEGLYRVNRLRFPDRGAELTAHLARVRVRAMVDTRLSLAAFAQYSSATGSAQVNLRLRYNAAEGHDLHLVWDEGLSVDGNGLAPRRPFRDRRAAMVKYSRTFRFGMPW